MVTLWSADRSQNEESYFFISRTLKGVPQIDDSRLNYMFTRVLLMAGTLVTPHGKHGGICT